MSHNSSTPPAPDFPVFLTVEQVASRIYVSRSKAYNMVKAGEIPSIRFDEQIRIPEKEFNNYLDSKLADVRAKFPSK